MGCCSSVSNEVSEPRSQNPHNLQGPIPASSFRSMIHPSQNSQQASSNIPIKRRSSRINEFQPGSPSPKKPVLTEEEQRREKSLEHKNRGNTYFKNKNYLSASQEYSKAIVITIKGFNLHLPFRKSIIKTLFIIQIEPFASNSFANLTK